MKLFREEVYQAHAAQWLGTVRLQRPVSFTALTVAALGVALTLVAFGAWGEINRKARLTGLLVPTLGSLGIVAPQAGVVRQLPVTEGQTVHTGDALMVLHTEHQSLLDGTRGDTAERAAQQIQTRLQSLDTERTLRQLQARQREDVLTDRIRTLQTQLRQAEEEQHLQQRRVQLAQTTLGRNEQLAAAGFVAAAQVQTRQEELIDAQARLQSAHRMRLGLVQDLQSLQGERQALTAQLQADLNQLDRSQASLSQELAENAARQTTVIAAPFDGTVTALNLKTGQSVQGGQTLATLVPLPDKTQAEAQAGLQAQLFAPSRTAGFVRPGQTVYVRYAAYPYQKFGLHTGRITSVSATPFAPNELPANLAPQLLAQVGSNEALYRINVQLDDQNIRAYGEPIPLKAGLTLEADVLQERRKVWEWVLEPVLAARAQMRLLGGQRAHSKAE